MPSELHIIQPKNGMMASRRSLLPMNIDRAFGPLKPELSRVCSSSVLVFPGNMPVAIMARPRLPTTSCTSPESDFFSGVSVSRLIFRTHTPCAADVRSSNRMSRFVTRSMKKAVPTTSVALIAAKIRSMMWDTCALPERFTNDSLHGEDANRQRQHRDPEDDITNPICK